MPQKRYAMTVTALIQASPRQIWETWERPELYCAIHQTHWAEIDFRVGGTNQVRFYADKPDGETFVYHEIVPEAKLVFSWQGHSDQLVTVLFTPQEGGTEVTITQNCGPEPLWIQNGLGGWAWILDSLAHYFATGRGLSHKAWRQQSDVYDIVLQKSSAPS